MLHGNQFVMVFSNRLDTELYARLFPSSGIFLFSSESINVPIWAARCLIRVMVCIPSWASQALRFTRLTISFCDLLYQSGIQSVRCLAYGYDLVVRDSSRYCRWERLKEAIRFPKT